MPRRDLSIQQQLAACELQITLVEADMALRGHEAWNKYMRKLYDVRQGHLEALQFTDTTDELKFEQGILWVTNQLLAVFGAGNQTVEALKQQRELLLAQHRDLRKTLRSMQDAALVPTPNHQPQGVT